MSQTIDLKTKYMGLALKNPLVASASPLSKNIDGVKGMEDAGAAAVVLYSLFEEQILHESTAMDHYLDRDSEGYAEATSYFPDLGDYNVGPDSYVDHVAAAKKAVDIPIIASLNGVTAGGWVQYAQKIEQAGADGIELNIYGVAASADQSSADVEQRYIDVLKAVKGAVKIPVAMKLSPFFSAMTNMAKRLDAAGADALVLFNRFYQPDIDLDNLEVTPNLTLSTPSSMRLPMRWIAILKGQVEANLGATTGVHDAEDVIKMLMVGADVTMMTAALLKNGVSHFSAVEADLVRWMEEHEYESVEQMKGSMSQRACGNPEAFERGNYMKALQTYDATGARRS